MYRRTLKVHIIVADLVIDAEELYERNVVTSGAMLKDRLCALSSNAHISVFLVEHAIINFTATRNKPPVSVDEDRRGGLPIKDNGLL